MRRRGVRARRQQGAPEARGRASAVWAPAWTGSRVLGATRRDAPAPRRRPEAAPERCAAGRAWDGVGATGVAYRCSSCSVSAPPPATAPAIASETATLPAPVEATIPSTPPSVPLAGAPVAAAVVAAPPPPSTLAFSAIPGTTGSASASSLRWVATSALNARQPSHARRCRLNGPRRSAAPVAVASSRRTSSHGVARASRLAASDVRAWNTSAFTFSRGQPSTVAIPAWSSAPSSASSNAARWSSGRDARSASSSRRSSRRSTVAASPSVEGSASSIATCARRARSRDRQRLRAIANSHGRRSIGFSLPRRSRNAARNVCWTASSASSRVPSMWRQKPRIAGW